MDSHMNLQWSDYLTPHRQKILFYKKSCLKVFLRKHYYHLQIKTLTPLSSSISGCIFSTPQKSAKVKLL